jgi:trans-aconitate methyltransferase
VSSPRGEGREQALVFGEVADDYDAFRPGYPAETFDAIIEFGGLHAGDRALEVGAGTGKATRPMLARGLEVHALEPSPGMADVLRRNGVDAEAARFDDYAPTAPFRLLYAAQAWHWVRCDDRYERAAAALQPGGTIALFWNQPREWDGELGAANDALYERYAPHMRRMTEKWKLDFTIDEIANHPAFTDATKHTTPWQEHYSAADYVRLLGTMSDHRMLDPDARTALHTAIGALVEEHGGIATVDYQTHAYLAHRC